ncbi:hypothetical protein ILYODFUR_008828 [Ilyodon furcidens]|uniref:Sleeping Beauty transposase HTH domain-containing protein n=1 Tax=Ilyodon furcidens TaxID=33524 RepID=A0ABV0SWS4_9TELE
MKIIEINQDIRKNILDLHKSDSSFGIISKCLKEPASSAQTIIGKPEQHENVQEGDGFCKPEINMQNVGINHPNCEVRGWLHHVVGVLSCKRDRCNSQNKGHRNETSCRNIGTISQDISQKVKLLPQMGLLKGQIIQSGMKILMEELK